MSVVDERMNERRCAARARQLRTASLVRVVLPLQEHCVPLCAVTRCYTLLLAHLWLVEDAVAAAIGDGVEIHVIVDRAAPDVDVALEEAGARFVELEGEALRPGGRR